MLQGLNPSLQRSRYAGSYAGRYSQIYTRVLPEYTTGTSISCSYRYVYTRVAWVPEYPRIISPGSLGTWAYPHQSTFPAGSLVLRSRSGHFVYPLTGLPIEQARVGTHVCCLLRDKRRITLFLSCTWRLRVRLVPR